MKKLIIATAILLGCSSKETGVNYIITNESSNPGAHSCEINVELPHKITLDKLKEVSEEIKSNNSSCERIFIRYLIKGISSISTQPWAKGFYNPEPEIEILGSSIGQDKEIDSIISTIKVPVYKQYVQNETSCYYLKKENDTLKVVTFLRNGLMSMDEFEQPVKAEKVDGGTRYNLIDDPEGERFRIYDDGDFGIYNSEDKKSVEAKLVTK
jgi:hypothetical protein